MYELIVNTYDVLNLIRRYNVCSGFRKITNKQKVFSTMCIQKIYRSFLESFF